MASRTATLKINLQTGSFDAQIRKARKTVENESSKMGKAIRTSLKGGFKAAGQGARDLAGSLKDTIKVAATLGGAFSLHAAIGDAVMLEDAYIQLGGSLTNLSDKAVSSAQAQAMVERVATKTGLAIQELVLVGNQLSNVPVEHFEDALERSQQQAKRLGVEGEQVAEVYSILFSKGLFKGGAEEIEMFTERMNRFAAAGMGMQVGDRLATNDIAEFAAFTKRLGGDLEQATRMMGLLEMSGGAVGKSGKDLGEAFEPIEEFFNTTGTPKALEELRVAAKVGKGDIVDTGDAFENFLKIMEMKGAKGKRVMQEYLKMFGNERSQKMLSDILGKKFTQQMFTGKVGHEQLVKRADEVRKAANAQFDVEAERVRIAKQNAEMAKAMSRVWSKAKNELTKAFSGAEVQAALASLMESMPAFAEGLASLVKVVAENPLKSIAAIIGLKVGGMFAGGMIKSAGAMAIKKLFADKLLSRTAAGALDKMFTKMDFTGSQVTGGGMSKGMGKLLKGLGLASVAVAAFHVGKMFVDSLIEEEFDKQAKRADVINVGKSGYGSDVRTVEEANAREKELVDVANRIAADINSMHDISRIHEELPKFLMAKAGGQKTPEQLATAQHDAALRELEIVRQKQGRLAHAADLAAQSLENVARINAGGRTGTTTVSRGPNTAPPNKPGSAEVGD